MKNLKKITATALSLVLALTVAACNTDGGSDKGKDTKGKTKDDYSDVTLLIWTPAEDQADDQGNWLKKQEESFNKENGYKVKFEHGTVGEADAITEVSKDLEAAADVFMYANDHLTRLIDAGGLARIGGKYEEYVRNTNGETAITSVSVDDKIYGFPFTSNTWFMYYDKSVFNEEDVKNLDTMLEKGKVAFPLNNGWYNAAFFLANGGTMFGDSTDATKGIDFAGEKGEEVIKYLVDLVANPNFINDKDDSGLVSLKEEDGADAIFSGSWNSAAVKANLGDNMGAAQLPTITINGEAKQLRSMAGTKAIGVNPASKNQTIAMEFAQWLARPEAQQDHFDLRGITPIHKELASSDKMKEEIVAMAELNTMNNTSFLQPAIQEMSNFWTPAENLGNELLEKKVTHENAAQYAEDFNKQINSSALD